MKANTIFLNAAIERLWITAFSMKFSKKVMNQEIKEKECWRKMDEGKAINKIQVNLSKEKVDFINDTH